MPRTKTISVLPVPVLLMAAFLGEGQPTASSQVASPSSPAVFGTFIGTTPSEEPVRLLLRIPSDPKPEIIEWKLTLYRNPKTSEPTRYEIQCDYGLTAPNVPGLAKRLASMKREGEWTESKGIKSNPHAIVFDLKGALSLLKIDDNIVHVLNRDRSLLIGDGGWSYSLNRAERAEKVEHNVAGSEADATRQISPLSTGPAVFGVFEGRSPCQGIARQLQIPVHRACFKAKWRVTLYQTHETLAPTTYKVEGTLYRRGAVEGSWTRIQGGEDDPQATVYRLKPSKNGPSMYLLRGDDNVLFFLDQNQRPLVGNLNFSYTLDRRSTNLDAP